MAQPAQNITREAVSGIDPIEGRPSLITGKPDFHEITEAVARPVEWKPPAGWYIAFTLSCTMLAVFLVSIAWLFWEGVGIWGNNVPVAWGWPIVNFVFWVGIAHAGTLISAILFLFRQRWRTSINRAAEAMTVFAVLCALTFPGIHTGRPWLAYWMIPAPNQMGLWPQFRSPLMWDVFAVSIYGMVSVLFWYVGLIPDLATLRDRAKTRVRQIVYGILSLGWRGSQRHWTHYEKAYLLLAGLATPLVLSVHSVVSFDFAVSQLPGWHSTIFPPYFVAGAIFSGMAMVVTLMVICRVAFKLEHLITMLHFDRMAKLILLTGSLVAYSYGVEFFVAWYSGNPFEQFTFLNRALGPYAWAYWIMIAGNVLAPQVFWFKRARRNIPTLFVVSILVNIGMWFERFIIVVTSLHRDFLPSRWGYFAPTLWDVTTLLGSFGLFFTLFCLFVRYFPMVAMSEVKGVLPEAQTESKAPGESRGYELKKVLTQAVGELIALTQAGKGTLLKRFAASAQRLLKIPVPLGRFVQPQHRAFGLLAEFNTPEQLMKACHKTRETGYTCWDAYSPFAVHGLGRAMGLRRSPVPWFVLILGLSGAAAGMLLQWWVSSVAYPIVISGKPFFSWPAFVPIMFECGVLGGALGAVAGFLLSSGLPRLYHSLFKSKPFEQVTDDKFFISIETRDPQFHLEQTERFLMELGANQVELVQV